MKFGDNPFKSDSNTWGAVVVTVIQIAAISCMLLVGNLQMTGTLNACCASVVVDICHKGVKQF
jgi:hypothetical protein